MEAQPIRLHSAKGSASVLGCWTAAAATAAAAAPPAVLSNGTAAAAAVADAMMGAPRLLPSLHVIAVMALMSKQYSTIIGCHVWRQEAGWCSHNINVALAGGLIWQAADCNAQHHCAAGSYNTN